MKKLLLSLSLCLGFLGSSHAQLPNGTYCPDFTGTDLNGNTHNLYTYLDAGYTSIVSGPDHPYHSNFNPGPGVGLGYDDLKIIEAYNFLHWVVTSEQGSPGFADALALAEVQAAMARSWESGTWEDVVQLGLFDSTSSN